MYKITPELAEKLKGKEFTKDNYFNPIEDTKGDWFISDEEFDKSDIEEAKAELKLIDVTKDKVDKSIYEQTKVTIEYLEAKDPKLPK
jgi:pyrroloquinoline quinone (PQQ) biosynthesis protein C